MTKEDYMRMKKERLAELLAERDKKEEVRRYWIDLIQTTPTNPHNNYLPPCYAPDGICANPFHDCINCPKMFGGGGTITTNTFNQKSQDNE